MSDSNSPVCTRVQNSTNAGENTKMFVGGLSWETTLDTFTQYFTLYGEIIDSVIMKDGNGKPRGFGFVTFKEANSVMNVLNAKPHVIDSKEVDPKLAEKRGSTHSGHINSSFTHQGTPISKKIFVGGIAPGTTEEDLKKFFLQYGSVVKAEIKIDKESNKPRGFGFLTMEDEQCVDKICTVQYHTVKGKNVECKKAQDPNAQGVNMGTNANNNNSINNNNHFQTPFTNTNYSMDPYYYYYGLNSQPYSYGQFYQYPTYPYDGFNNSFSPDSSQRNFSSYLTQNPYQTQAPYMYPYTMHANDYGNGGTSSTGTSFARGNGSKSAPLSTGLNGQIPNNRSGIAANGATYYY